MMLRRCLGETVFDAWSLTDLPGRLEAAAKSAEGSGQRVGSRRRLVGHGAVSAAGGRGIETPTILRLSEAPRKALATGKGRENGEAALEHYTETKTVAIKLG
jgi:hypothetical protein